VSKAEDRFVDLSNVEPSAEALKLGAEIDKDPRLVECILKETLSISRKRLGALIVRQRLGIVSANAGIDLSNALPHGAKPGAGPWALLLPENPDATAETIGSRLSDRYACTVGVVITDSLGRPFRVGTVGAAIGVAGMPAIWDQRGLPDLDGRTMEHTITAFADQVAAAADLVAGQAGEGTPVVVVRGLFWPTAPAGTAQQLIRDSDEDLYC
jgi:coenzyme F420-0:L-glutamate ligase/coenzyme F420-1:gamma-L-glutamate ligase